MNFVKKNSYTILLVVIFFIGLCLILYPSVADWWNSFHMSRAVASYEETIANISNEEYEKMQSSAVAYNDRLAKKNYQTLDLSKEDKEVYEKELDVTGTGVMGYIVIDKIKVKLPIYHGTDDGVLQIAIGHIEGTSLPVGGPSTHCVLSGHRGLTSAKLFTRLDEMEVGDMFEVRTLGNSMYYQVESIDVVLPTEVDSLKIVPGEDLVTLTTCTPYGINTHRLLITGKRVEDYSTGFIRVTNDARQIDRNLVAAIIAVPLLSGLLIYLLIITRKGEKK